MRLFTLSPSFQLAAFAECEALFLQAQQEPLPAYIPSNPPPMPEQPWDVYSRLFGGTSTSKRRTVPYPIPERNCPKKVLVTATRSPDAATEGMNPRIWKKAVPNKTCKVKLAGLGERAWRKRLGQIQAAKSRERRSREEAMCWWVYHEGAVRQQQKLLDEARLRQEAEYTKAMMLEQERSRQEEEARQQQQQQQQQEMARQEERRQAEAARQQSIQEENAQQEQDRQAKAAEDEEMGGGEQDRQRPEEQKPEEEDSEEEEEKPEEEEEEEEKPVEQPSLTGDELIQWQIELIEKTMKQSFQSMELSSELDAALSLF